MPVDDLAYLRKTVPLLTGAFPRECPICGYSGKFKAFGRAPRLDAQCRGCGSLERHRLLYLSCIGNGGLDGCQSLLHFAPEPILENLLRPRIAGYTTTDITGRNVDLKLDIENLEIESGSFDAVMCNHVLEHVHDGKAMREIWRILTPGGRLYCMVPIVEGWDETYENDAVRDPDDRVLHFGQDDHVRYYGSDFRKRLADAGFAVEEYTATGQDVVRYGLTRGEKVFIGRKPEANGG